MAGDVRVGISGWNYPAWRGQFYPHGLPHRDELSYAAQRLTTVEINASFYSLQRPESYRRWRDATPDGFLFAVKGSRYITHLKRLRGIDAALPNFLASGVLALDGKLGPVLWQLPPTLSFDATLLGEFFSGLPRSRGEAAWLARRHDQRLTGRAWTGTADDRPLLHAVEVRHDSYRAPAFADLARAHGVAVVLADTGGRWPVLPEPTAEFCYLRLHGPDELYAGGYDGAALDRWAAVIEGFRPRDVYVYFDNDVHGRAPFDAMALAARFSSG